MGHFSICLAIPIVCTHTHIMLRHVESIACSRSGQQRRLVSSKDEETRAVSHEPDSEPAGGGGGQEWGRSQDMLSARRPYERAHPSNNSTCFTSVLLLPLHMHFRAKGLQVPRGGSPWCRAASSARLTPCHHHLLALL